MHRELHPLVHHLIKHAQPGQGRYGGLRVIAVVAVLCFIGWSVFNGRPEFPLVAGPSAERLQQELAEVVSSAEGRINASECRMSGNRRLGVQCPVYVGSIDVLETALAKGGWTEAKGPPLANRDREREYQKADAILFVTLKGGVVTDLGIKRW